MKKRDSEPSMGQGIQAWADKLKETHPALAKMLSEPREVGHAAVAELDLPRYEYVLACANEILENPDAYFNQLSSERFFVFLRPGGGTPVRKTKLTRKEAMAFIQETTGDAPENWRAIISESADVIYGGNVHVSREGRAVVEFRRGDQGPISAGTVTPEFRAWRDRFTGVWRYSFDDSRLRTLVQMTMRHISHTGKDFPPGMYEFHLVPSEEDENYLEPRFVDYQKDW